MRQADYRKRWLGVVAMAVALAAGGCGSGDLAGSDGSSSSGGTTSASAEGLWQGTDSASGLTLTGIIDAAGAADFIRSDGTQYSGTAQVSADTLIIALDVNTQLGSQFADGSTYGVGTLNATFTAGSSISGTLSFTTSANNTVGSSWALTFNNLFNAGSSQTAISGNYLDGSTGDPLNGAAFSITSLGAVNAQSATTGCVLNGQISTADATHNAYEVTYTLENCAGADVALNGIQFTGLALLDSNTSPAQVVIGVRGQASSGVSYGWVSALTRN
jgi:hypothetical protein